MLFRSFDIALIVLTVWLIMYAFSYLYSIATPVFLSFLIFACIEPIAKRLHRLGIKKSIASAISVLFFTLVILGAFVGAGLLVTNEIRSLVARLPEYQSMFMSQASELIEWVKAKIGVVPDDLVANSQDIIAQRSEERRVGKESRL